MSQTVAFVLPPPVALALVVMLLVLLVLSAVALSLRKPAPLRLPAGESGESGESGYDGSGEGDGFRLGHLRIDGLGELAGPQRRVR
ncbi:hypothetical protein [Massilia sp. X63]|uniref:hypothetical protein n=1 Tax=Massilia sp. X63 TaxID=3237285 RepID=UPI0034DCEF64